jgi:choline-glycine betaine transporter
MAHRRHGRWLRHPATLISMVTNLGIGALVVQSGLVYLFGIRIRRRCWWRSCW